jgi:adenine deaminase
MRTRERIFVIVCLCALFGASSVGAIVVLAQQAGAAVEQQPAARVPSATFVIRNARIVTVSGPEIESGTLVIRDGKIEAVGANVAAPAGAQERDARGLSV